MKNSNTKYKPHYDPLVDKTPGLNVDFAPTYWVATAGEVPEDDSLINSDVDVDVAIIGGGFTGLGTAMFLAKEHGIKATVLEANKPGWGCTSRNGGQAHLAWGRLSRSQWIKRWGVDMAKKIHANTLEGFEVFQDLTKDIPCDPFGDGNILIAHNGNALKKLQLESQLCNEVFNYRCKIVDRNTVFNKFMKDREAYGALVEPVGIAVHPLKLAFGYMRIARSYGATVHPGSPVVDWQTRSNVHYLKTPGGTVKARSVVVATAGYTHPSLHRLLAYKNMPIMANSAVTSVLSDAQIESCGFNSHLFMTDSRRLRYYYRFLPDNRLQIGTRSAISGADAENPKHLQIIKEAIARKFPHLKDIAIDYFWSGWMCISHDMMPRIVQPDKQQQIFYAQGYSGNGVSFSAYAAKKLAQLVSGIPIKETDLPIFTTPLPGHILRPLRRTGQHLLFGYFSMMDKLR
ncbi:MAG: FAD-binding oxidoreductase [bacterium]|nr:FAD-binding oxidoreductase [bacterium]